jgi:3-deoxy-D-manno-octulosonic-acid transferase
MGFVLNVVYLGAILAAFPWLLYQRIRHGKYRDGWSAKFWGQIPRRSGDRPCIWLHAVSVGEVNVLEPILKRWERLHPEWDCVISTTTQTGYQLACKKYGPRTVFYCPLDFTWAVERAVQRIRPSLLVLAELELWPNLIFAVRKHGAKVAVINGRLGDRSFRGYTSIRPLVHRLLSRVGLIAVQNEDYAQRFLALGARQRFIRCTGSIKFDGARSNRNSPEVQDLAQLAGIAPDDIVFLVGSTQDPEESLALSVFRRLSDESPKLRLILVPRHPERFDEVAALLDRSGIPWQRRSHLAANSRFSSPESRVLLVDAVGELGHWWGTAQIAFVGGSLTNRGGQNMIEPAAYGAAVSFGPNIWNFRDVASLMIERNAAVIVRDEQQLEQFVHRCLADPAFADELGCNAKELVRQQQGAADRTIALLEQLVIRNVNVDRVDRAA